MTEPVRNPRKAEKWLLLAALVLGVGAVFGTPYRGDVVTLNARELAVIVERKQDHITVQELADRIVAGDVSFRLLDLREDSSFAEYHIPGAELVTLTDLPDYPIFRNEEIILYSDGGIHAAQGWFLLRAMGFKGVHTIFGGLDTWKEEILFPILADVEGDASAVERLRYVSEYFGGQPITDGVRSQESFNAPLPKIEMPATQTPVVRRRTKRKEGC